ncbi:MAG TPA: transcription elongation factor GreA [Candidatus Saccharimonadales bacterium]|nr:transcription elongation factor GreA [Candidatus Saccharimonadales bacterium]
MKKAYQLTAAGKADLELELSELKSRRSEIAQKIADARDYGDLSENSEYAAARDEQGQVESRIAEIEEILQNATLIKGRTSKPTKVMLGVQVDLESDKKKKVSYTIVGSVEADPLAGRISDESPIGQALIGKAVGDSVTIKTPGGDASYAVVAIS